jgi:uncharacterized protein
MIQYYPKTASFMEERMSRNTCGHDHLHVFRVVSLAKQIAKQEIGFDEEADKKIELLALCHDLLDRKVQACTSLQLLQHLQGSLPMDFSFPEIRRLVGVCQEFGSSYRPQNLVEKCVKDADALDAMGAVGIARVFAYGGAKDVPYFVPGAIPREYQSGVNSESVMTCFDEKLLHLHEKMHTSTGAQMARQRRERLFIFYTQFMQEIKEAE